MKHKKHKNKKLLYISFVLGFLFLNMFLSNLILNQAPIINDDFDKNVDDKNYQNLFLDDNLKIQDLSSENIYSGVGAAWNLTHFANRTDTDLKVSFSEGSFDNSQGVPLGGGWEGYQLNATINDLYDERNWNNGTFDFGPDDGSYTAGEDDSATMPIISNNNFQNWTFHSYDNDSIGVAVSNAMSGNYINSGGRDYLELRMNEGTRMIFGEAWAAYDGSDKCMWNSSFSLPRGRLIDSTLEFDVNPFYLANTNDFALVFYINDQKIYSEGTYNLEQDAGGENNWLHISYSQSKWKNQSNVFSGVLDDSDVKISVGLEALGSNSQIGHDENQILYIDNVELNTRAEVKPSQIGLMMNNTSVKDVDWGKGEVDLEAQGNNWQGNKVIVNLSSTDTGILDNYEIELKTDINLHARKDAPETIYEAKESSAGTSFSVSNDSLVEWDSYAYVEPPEYYEETLMIVEFPNDVNITRVFDPQNPTINILGDCTNSTPGVLLIPISNISGTPDGFWKLEAISPNYCDVLSIYNDETGSWVKNSVFYSGENINIRVNITKTSIIQNYIQSTQASLTIRFPDGSEWAAKRQIASPNADGLVNFSAFQIPAVAGADYQAGEYEVIVTWNNSYSTHLANETGIMYKKFIVEHDSTLEPHDDVYFIENVKKGNIVNIKVLFEDSEDQTPITGATVYAKNSTGDRLDFSQVSEDDGYYELEFNTGTVNPGNRSLEIFANSTYYLNKKINITVDVIQETLLTVDNDFITDVPYRDNFTIIFNYTRKDSPQNEITINDKNEEFSTSWNGEHTVRQNGDGTYNLTCNTTNYIAGVLHTFNFSLNVYQYESQVQKIYVFITEIGSELEIWVNGTPFSANDIYNADVSGKINLTARYKDAKGGFIPNADIEVTGEVLDANLTYIPLKNYYYVLLNASDLGQGIDILTVYAESSYFKPASIPFIVEISENKTNIQILFNGKDYTADPTIELPLGAQLNLTVRYTDITGGHIEGASLNLSIGMVDSLTENIALKQYSITISSTQLGIGVKIIRLIAEKSNFETQLEDLRIAVRKIRTAVIVDEDNIEINPGEDVTLVIELIDLDNGGRIRGAIISYDWKLKDDDFEETSGGIYEADLDDVPEGTYTITIIISTTGNEYDFIEVEITLSVVSPQEETLLFQILLAVAIIISAGLVGYIIYYQRIGKYPKTVRKVRKFRRTLKKSKAPSVEISSRKDALKEVFSEHLGDTSKDIKSLDKSDKISPEMAKKKLKMPSKNAIKIDVKESSGKSSEKGGNSINKPSQKAVDVDKNLNKLKNDKLPKKNITTTSKKSIKSKKYRGKKLFKNLKYGQFKRIFFLGFILMFLMFNIFILNLNNNQNPNLTDNHNNDQINLDFLNNKPKTEELDIIGNDINYNDIGAAWNVTHFANRTDSDLSVSFTNNSYDNSQGVPLGSGWEGYNLEANIKNLRDTRQWINGTMHYGEDDNSLTSDEDDTNDIQDWTFSRTGDSNNDMSGNYLDNDVGIGDGNDCLELRLDGDGWTHATRGQRYSYDAGDNCDWSYSTNIPRGNVIDSSFKFDIKPVHIAYANSWAVYVYINDYEILSLDIIDLRNIGEGSWGTVGLPQDAWTNSDVFSNPLDGSQTEIEIRLAYTASSLNFGLEDGPQVDYQQVLIDNVELTVEAEVQPDQIGLVMNSTDVNNIDWGKGSIDVSGSWSGVDSVYANFSSDNIIDLSGYDVDFEADLNLYAKKDSLDTLYETDTNSLGALFSVGNDSDADWVSYGFVAVPTGYEQTLMRVEVPSDVNVWLVSSPQQPLFNCFGSCTFADGVLQIPVSEISSPSKPNGFWKLQATSDNYFTDMNIYNDVTGSWVLNSTFYSGDNINITANIDKTSIIEDYIQLTPASLDIRFPNGSIWTAQHQKILSDSDGLINFNDFQIPDEDGYDYQAGVYQAIVTWNNSISPGSLANETGVIVKYFTVIHRAELAPNDGIYYIENIIDDGIENIEVTFKDDISRAAIKGATVYYKNSTDDITYFSEKSSGLYSVAYDTTKAQAGNNTLRIFANSTFYLNQKINITLDVTKQTVLTLDNDYITVASRNNFSILFNYTEFNSPDTGINTNDYSTDWADDYSFTQVAPGRYNLTCNTSTLEANKLHTLILSVSANKYESQSTPVRIYIGQLGSDIELRVNDSLTENNGLYTCEVWQTINITVRYTDASGSLLNGANVTLLGIGDLTKHPVYDQYNITISATQLGQGIDTLTIYANKTNYNPQIIQFVVRITERKTKMSIFIDNVNSTLNPSVERPLTSTLGVKIYYTDTQNNHIEDADVRLLIGERVFKTLTENKAAGYYSTSFLVDQLGLGVKIVSVDANKTNYEPIVDDMRIAVRQIRTEVQTEDGDSKYEIRPGENLNLIIELINLDFGGNIEEAEVSYSWDLEDGDLEETDDGTYEILLENVPEGIYTITITVYKEGGAYDFEDYEITLVVKRPEGESLLYLILFIVAGVVATGLAGYLVAYQTVLKYPKPVRKVRKFRRKLKRAKAPNVDITPREKAIKKIFSKELGDVESLLKGKSVAKIVSMDKISDKLTSITPLKSDAKKENK